MSKNEAKMSKNEQNRLYEGRFLRLRHPLDVYNDQKHSETPGTWSGTTPLAFVQSKVGSRSKNEQK